MKLVFSIPFKEHSEIHHAFSILQEGSETSVTVLHKYSPNLLFYRNILASKINGATTRGQTAEARRTTILQPVEQKPHSQKDRQDKKTEDYVPDERKR